MFWSVRCVIPPGFGLRSLLFVQVLVCEACYSPRFWSVKHVVSLAFGL